MNIVNGTVPHMVKVQLDTKPDAKRDIEVCLYIPLDESAEGIASKLAQSARLLVNTARDIGFATENAKVTSVDGAGCHIPVSEGRSMDDKLASLVAPKGADTE